MFFLNKTYNGMQFLNNNNFTKIVRLMYNAYRYYRLRNLLVSLQSETPSLCVNWVMEDKAAMPG